MDVRIEFESIAPTREVEAQVRAEAARLGEACPAAERCHVTVEERAPRPYKRKRFHVGVELRIRGRDVVVNREDDADLIAAVRQAVAAAERRVRDYRLAP